MKKKATGKIKLQPEFDEELQKEVLTCYLLPQQNFHTPSMGNVYTSCWHKTRSNRFLNHKSSLIYEANLKWQTKKPHADSHSHKHDENNNHHHQHHHHHHKHCV